MLLLGFLGSMLDFLLLLLLQPLLEHLMEVSGIHYLVQESRDLLSHLWRKVEYLIQVEPNRVLPQLLTER